MKHLRNIVLISAALLIVGSSLGLALPVMVEKVLAAGCPAPDIMFGRYKWCGYFYSRFEDHGTYVRDAGVPASVNNVEAFISMLEGDLYSGDVHRNAAAATIIRIMGGAPVPAPPLAVGTPKPVTVAMIDEFKDRLRGFSGISENGSQSFGTSGHIDWFHSDYMHCGDYNSYYQNTYHDVAPYVITSSNTPECNNGGIRFDHIFIYDTSGNILWRVRRLCMNPLGNIPALPEAAQPYNLLPNVSVTQGASPLANGSYVDAGSSVTFGYGVTNTLSGTATGIDCDLYANNYTGFHAIPSPADATGGPPVGPTCTDTFGPGATSLGSETVNNLPANTSVCRTLYVNPSQPSGGPLGYEACVYVTAKPYFRTYGGDISAGNSQPTACGTSVNAAIVSWNRESAGGYGGAGVQYAGYALDVIYDVATDLGNAAGSAAPPSGLSFANTTASGPSNFGGSFGPSSLPCIANYYGTPTGTPLPAIHPLSALNDTYTATGPVTLSGDVTSGKKVVIYVNGNVVIDNPILYPGAWSAADIPLFAVIATGNIYIGGNVTELNGTFISQGGTIYTCATGQVPAVPTSAGYYASCSNRLVVNGAFIARQVQLLRANGSVGLSSASEPNTSGNIGEVFNYNPAFWIPQPTSGVTTVDYDSITSLPPIL